MGSGQVDEHDAAGTANDAERQDQAPLIPLGSERGGTDAPRRPVSRSRDSPWVAARYAQPALRTLCRYAGRNVSHCRIPLAAGNPGGPMINGTYRPGGRSTDAGALAAIRSVPSSRRLGAGGQVDRAPG